MTNRSAHAPVLNGIDHKPSMLAPVTDWRGMGKSEHFVQFYEEDRFLVKSVAGFLGAGMREGEAAIVIATEAHLAGINEQLQQDGINPAESRVRDLYYPLNAAETLAKIMVDGSPNPLAFRQVIGGLIARITAEGRPLRAFGEMVALLWQNEDAEGAVHLEQLWNDLGREFCFALFCAYPMKGFADKGHSEPFAHICQAHSRVLPAESYSSNTESDGRLRTISLLQQKAASLEAEIVRRKQAEKELAAQKRELSDFLEHATEGIHQVAADGKILWANKAELDLLGYTAGEYIGRDIREFYMDPMVIADILERLSRGEELKDCEARLKHKDGSIRHVSINSNVCWDGDRFRYTRCFTRDITDRKRMAEILEQTVALRTAQLRETVAELETFSYSVSHDMRSPLRAMQGYAKALIMDYSDKLDSNAVKCLGRIERAASRLDLLIRDILAYSRIAKEQIELKSIALRPLLNDLIQQHPELQKFSATISREQLTHSVLGHEAYLTQCFTNLVDNALKFVAPGAKRTVRLRSELIGSRVRVSVIDNGIGIAPEHYDRVFQIFGRVYPEKCYPGTGIGLAVVKKAVARMGGEVGFESKPGHGSTFWFTLAHAPDGFKHSLLLAEDNEDNALDLGQFQKKAARAET